MRCVVWAAVALLALGERAQSADAPMLVVPGKAGVPVIINGGDASWCIVEGDFGLDRPGQTPVTVVSCPDWPSWQLSSGRRYFPAFGRQPGYGRYEIIPPLNRKLPPPAPRYYHEWGTQSDPLPATADPPANVEISAAPQIDTRRRKFRRHH